MNPHRGLPQQLINHLVGRKEEWVSKGELTADKLWYHKEGVRYGKRYLPETVGRCLRSLEESRIIAVKEDGISVKYRYIPHEWRMKYIPVSQRPLGAKSTLFKKS